MNKIAFFFSFLLLLVSCQEKVITDNGVSTNALRQKTAVHAYVQPKFTIQAPVNHFELDVSKDQLLVTYKNSKIYISKNSFVDKSGKDISGKIKVDFSEFHTQGELIASKFPMVYTDEKGREKDFESAGMFEIQASQEGECIYLKTGKTIKVDLYTEDASTFNFYRLKEDKGNWDELQKNCKPIQNPLKRQLQEKIEQLNALPTVLPKKPIAYAPNDRVFDINIDFRKHRQLADLNGAMWKITETDSAKLKRIKTKFFKQVYTFIDVTPYESPFLEFNLTFATGKDTMRFRGAPVMKGELLKKVEGKYQEMVASITQKINELKASREAEKRENELLRSMNIDQLGVYNYDRQFKDADAIPMLAEFKFEGVSDSTTLATINVYLIPAQKNVVIRYTPDTYMKFAINPFENNKLIAVLPDNTIYRLSNTELQALNLENHKDKRVEIVLKKQTNPVKNANQLNDVIAKL